MGAHVDETPDTLGSLESMTLEEIQNLSFGDVQALERQLLEEELSPERLQEMVGDAWAHIHAATRQLTAVLNRMDGEGPYDMGDGVALFLRGNLCRIEEVTDGRLL